MWNLLLHQGNTVHFKSGTCDVSNTFDGRKWAYLCFFLKNWISDSCQNFQLFDVSERVFRLQVHLHNFLEVLATRCGYVKPSPTSEEHSALWIRNVRHTKVSLHIFFEHYVVFQRLSHLLILTSLVSAHRSKVFTFQSLSEKNPKNGVFNFDGRLNFVNAKGTWVGSLTTSP